jgi:4-amino-4-deoxy-L-arabinose transferase-like glycosyltransferase
LGIGWDEAADMGISQSYSTPRGFFFGSSRDPSQTRLPMFLVALVFRIAGTSNLLLARLASIVVGGLTILGTYIYGKERFSEMIGLLAAALLAVNPFFLAFARLAFTESDIYLACTLTWLLVILSRLQAKPALDYAVLGGILLGLSLASKATAVFILPALFIWFFLNAWNAPAVNDITAQLKTRSAWSLLLLSASAIALALIGIMVSRQLNKEGVRSLVHLLNYGIAVLGWLFLLGWAIRFRRHTAHSLALFAYLTAFGVLTFLIIPPEHIINRMIIESLISRASSEMGFSITFLGELLAMHTFTILLRSTPILGLGLLAGFIIGLTQWRRRDLTLPLLVVTFYALGIVLLPLAQPFYTIPILPILTLLAADQLVRFHSRRRMIAVALSILGLVWWGVEMKQSYPDYHLNGYQWLGERAFFGRSSIGYRSIVYIPSDGVQQSMVWLNEHAQPGQSAQLYVGPWHIVRSLAPNPAYTITDGSGQGLETKPDYVVIHIGALIRQGEGNDNPRGDIYDYPFDLKVLHNEYEQVFAVERAFGLKVASVWKRK